MTHPRVSFAPKLAAVVREGERSAASDAAVAPQRLVLMRVAMVALLVVALGFALHFGTASHRDDIRRARISEAIATSGVASMPPEAQNGLGSETHE